MRIKLFIALIPLLALFSCNKNKYQVKLKGQFLNAENQVVYFEELDPEEDILIDQLTIDSKGKFKFKVDSKYPEFFQLRVNEITVPLILKGKSKVEVKGDISSFPESITIKGSALSDSILQMDKKFYKINDQINNRLQRLNANTSKDSAETILRSIDSIKTSFRKELVRHIISNTSSLSSIFALYQQYANGEMVLGKVKDIQYYKIVSDSLNKYYPQSKHVKALKSSVKTMYSDYGLLKVNSIVNTTNVSVEERIPEIHLYDVDGKLRKLSDLSGKYVLLSFWSSQNDVSVGYNIELKNLYKKYKKKGFEIYSVSIDTSEQLWKKAIYFDELDWINVKENTSAYPYYAGVYNINQIPANFLIDPSQQNILGKNVAVDVLDKGLKELLD